MNWTVFQRVAGVSRLACMQQTHYGMHALIFSHTQMTTRAGSLVYVRVRIVCYRSQGLTGEKVEYWTCICMYLAILAVCATSTLVSAYLRQQYGNLKLAWGSSLKKNSQVWWNKYSPRMLVSCCKSSSTWPVVRPPTHGILALSHCMNASQLQLKFNLSENYHQKPSNLAEKSSHHRPQTTNLGLSMCILESPVALLWMFIRNYWDGWYIELVMQTSGTWCRTTGLKIKMIAAVVVLSHSVIYLRSL